jgi:hypothetical protein
MTITVVSCRVATGLCAATTRNLSAENINKVVMGLNLLRFLTVTVVLTRAFLVVPVVYAAVFSLTGFFISAPFKSKVS